MSEKQQGKIYERIKEYREKNETEDPYADRDEKAGRDAALFAVEKILDDVKAELTTKLRNIIKNSELMTAETENEKTLKALILQQSLIKAYVEWFKENFGEP